MKSSRSILAVIALAGSVALAGCGPKAVFGLSSDDNNPDRLGKALATRTLPSAPGPANALGKPLVFALLGGTEQRKLVAYDVEAGAPLWTVDADVQSRIAVGGAVVVAREATQLIIRNVKDGAVRAKVALDGELLGIATDGERIYVTTQRGDVKKPIWALIAYNLDGGVLWQNDSPGSLGAPAVQGGLVFSPYLKQWLAVLDARTGAQLTRIRGLDEEISFVRTTSDATYFGSKVGAFRLDVKAATGSRGGSTYGTVKLPTQLTGADFGRDMFDPIQAGYTAYDRRRILWRADPAADGALAFGGDLVAVHFFRFVFGLTPDGELRWAYSQPRVELVASDRSDAVVVGLAADGSFVALDPATGAVRAASKLDPGGGRVLGATFDLDGWDPAGAGAPPSTVGALVSIARDRDARFEGIKQYAVAALANLQGAAVTHDLVGIVLDPRIPAALHDSVAALLIRRQDPAGLPALTDALATRADFLTGAQPVGLVEVSRAIAALGEVTLDAAEVDRALVALTAQAFDPATAPLARLELTRALIAIGHGRERDDLRNELVTYRADPSFAAETELVTAIIGSLAQGSPEDRETLRMVAEDARSAPVVVAVAKSAIGQ